MGLNPDVELWWKTSEEPRFVYHAGALICRTYRMIFDTTPCTLNVPKAGCDADGPFVIQTFEPLDM